MWVSTPHTEQTNGIHPRHIYSALMVCQTTGITHRRIRRASPLCLWSPGLAHSLNPYSLSIRYACTVVSDTDGDGSCHSVWCRIEYILIRPRPTDIFRIVCIQWSDIYIPLCSLCMYMSERLSTDSPGKLNNPLERHTWRLVLSFDLRSYRIQD